MQPIKLVDRILVVLTNVLVTADQAYSPNLCSPVPKPCSPVPKFHGTDVPRCFYFNSGHYYKLFANLFLEHDSRLWLWFWLMMEFGLDWSYGYG